MPLVAHYWADLQLVHGFRCYDYIMPNAKCQRVLVWLSLWSPYVIGQTIIFLPCDFYLLISFFPRLISAVGDWISTILPHTVWP